MRKLKLFFACLLMAVLSIGQVWAVDYELVYTLDGSVTTGGNSNYTQDGGGLTQDGIDWSVTGNTTINPWRIGGKNLSGVDRLAYSKTAIADNIAKIEIEHGTATLTVNSIKVEVASDAAFSNIISTFNESYSSNVTITELRPDGKDWTGRYYRITYNVTAGGSNSYVQLKSVKFYKEKSADDPVLESITITGDLDNKSYEVGQSIDFSGLTATGNYDDDSHADLTSSVEWSFSPALTAGLTSVTVTATLDEISGNKPITGLTVTEHTVTPGTYDIPTDNDLWGTSYSGQASGISTLSGSKNDVSITINKNTGSTMYVTGSQTRIYSGYTMVFSVPNGYAITALQFTADGSNWAGEHTADVGTMTDNKNWSGEAKTVTISVAGTCRMKAVKVTYAVAAPSKTETGLAYAEADQKKLTKLGEAFTAPTLENPNNLTVAYASNNTEVAEVAANGAVTIKAVGVATITASYDEDETYQAGSASYTIGVTAHAGTEADPYVAADVKIAIDAKGTVENAYATGLVSNVVTTSLPAEGYISFYFSADGLTSGQQIEAYKCFGLNSTQFEAVSDVVTGATVIVTGNLKKFNSTYEFDQNCHLVSYMAPAAEKTHIANTKETAYTVAQAITYAADGVTYDLDDYVYVSGVVYDVKSFNTTNGTLDIYIKDAGQENQFELFKCAGINDGSATTPFEALTDVQEGDEVIAYGQLTVYNAMSELKSGNYLVELTRPEVAVTSVAMTESTAEVEVGSTVTLHASVLPENATNKGINWTVQSGSDKASVADGVVTGIEEGEAVIRAASAADATKYAECTVTVNAADPTKHVVTFDATVDLAENDVTTLTKSNVTIESSDLDGINNTSGNPQAYYQTFKNDDLTISCSAGNITKIELTCESSNPASGFGEGITSGVWTGNAASVTFTADVKQVRINTITVTYKEDNRAAADLAWSTDAVELTVGDEFTAPTLDNPNSIAAGEITIASDNTDLATVSEGVVSLVADATGEATITATFAGNDDYKPAVVSYTITVNAAAPAVLTDYYEKVTETAGIVEGTYLIVYEDGENSLAFNGGLETLDAESNTIAVTITNDNKIGVTEQTAAATFYIEPAAGTVKSASNHYIGVSSWSNGLKQTDTYVHNVLEIDGDGNAQVGIYNANWNTTGGTMRLQYNKSAGQTRFRYYKNGGQQSIQLYKLANEVIKADPELAWSDDVEQTVGDAFTSPTLSYADGITGTITYSSDKETVATVDANGVISVVADATGTAHITASYAGDENFKAGSAVCTIKINPAHSIYVSPSLNVNFGSVAKDAIVDDKVITVTLIGVDAATATLGGTNPEVFSISPAALTASGDITISASSATAGTFAAKLTISDDAGVAESKVVNISLTVTDPAAEETPISTSTKWVVATAADLVDGAEVIITGVKDEVVYAMGEQKSTNRAGYAAAVDGEGVLTPGEGTMSFTLVAQEAEGVFALRTSDGKYLYAASNGSNHLKTQDVVNDSARWTLTTTSAVAVKTGLRNVMQFNGSGQNMLFSCYATANQSAIQLYVPKPATPEPPVEDWTEGVRTGLTEGWYYTMCLEKAVTDVRGASIWRVLSKAANGTDVILEEAELPLAAGRPYIFYATAANLDVIYTGDAVLAPVNDNDNHGLIGSFEKVKIANVNTNYIIYNNQLYYVNSDNVYVGENRAYLNMNGVPAYGSEPVQGNAPRRRVTMHTNAPQVATGMDELNASETPVKVMINGQMYILRGEKMYDATGRLVK